MSQVPAVWPYVAKVLVTAVVVVAVSEVGRRHAFWAAVLASLPLTSLLAFVWLHLGGGEAEQLARLSTGIFWLVLPSLVLFLLLPVLLRAGVGFWLSLGLSSAATVAAYAAMAAVLTRAGVRL
ncbi:hypothetical protein [Aquabacterium sp. J223]|uniref:hypothetical protein n=1 Tax=Aquabacterium sp. J223 TaxID=2898431 RepID=UPI0021AD8847|nr:hypothetical protein [Aquabacterium sp. J223]UUX95552.1 hypothetical protein LRS07_20500 [Aquabacterium sp. J223]